MLKFYRYIIFFIMLSNSILYAKTIIRIAPPESATDTRYIFPKDLLQKILDVTTKDYGDFEIVTTGTVLTSSRRNEELRKNDNTIDVLWTPTSLEKEQNMLPIKIPIDKGLLGYRLFYIRKKDQNKFFKGMTLKDLSANFVAGQGIGWSDIQILEEAGIKVEKAKYNLLISMLIGKRFDFFPRGAPEIFDEYDALLKEAQVNDVNNIREELVIEKNIILIYPFAMYYFVKKSNTKLAERIFSGLSKLYQAKEFDDFWHNHKTIKKIFELSNIYNRSPIFIPNNTLPKDVPLNEKKYWLNIYKEK